MAVFPTQVGVILHAKVEEAMQESVPHTGGGDPTFVCFVNFDLVCSPHRWG